MREPGPQSAEALFNQGLAAGLDPDPARPGRATPETLPVYRVTARRSRWVHRRCAVCGHSFRPGDEVLVFPDGRVIHDMPGLRCVGAPAPDPADCADTGDPSVPADFFAGLTTAWPIPHDVPLVRLQPADPLLAPPRLGHQRAQCRVCGHTLRPGDLVVVCPCDPHEPRCRAAVHRDLLKQLHCWDDWMQSPHHRTSCIGMT